MPAARKSRKTTEHDVEKQISAYLKVALPSEVICFHIPNGAKLGAQQLWKMRAAGMVAGIPDRCILHNSRAYFIEVKRPGGDVSESQRQMFPRIEKAGCSVAICRSAEDVERALVAWGIPLKARMLPLTEGA